MSYWYLQHVVSSPVLFVKDYGFLFFICIVFCVLAYWLFVKQGYGVHSAIDLGYKNALLLTENVCSAYAKSTVLDCIDNTSIKSIFYIGVSLPFAATASLEHRLERIRKHHYKD